VHIDLSTVMLLPVQCLVPYIFIVHVSKQTQLYISNTTDRKGLLVSEEITTKSQTVHHLPKKQSQRS